MNNTLSPIAYEISLPTSRVASLWPRDVSSVLVSNKPRCPDLEQGVSRLRRMLYLDALPFLLSAGLDVAEGSGFLSVVSCGIPTS